jgi:hypothetical protein
MLQNGVEEFRKKFFEDFIRIEKEKELALKRQQRNCFHIFQIVSGNIECTKCGIYKKTSPNQYNTFMR